MHIVYARKGLPTPERRHATGGAIFLAGPTPRRRLLVRSWRPQALALLERRGFDGFVFVPEDEDGGMRGDKQQQRAWEWDALEAADVILFWIPRGRYRLPGFTTNIEFGYWAGREADKVVVGAPKEARKMSYIRAFCNRGDVAIPTCSTLEATVSLAVALTRVES